MQQTRLDHWLKKRLTHVTRFYCNVLPQDLPNETKVEESPEGRSSSHRFRVTSSSEQITILLADLFRLQGITFAAQVDESSGFLSKLVSRPRRSTTYDAIWLIGILAVVIGGIALVLLTGGIDKLVNSIQEWFAENI